MIDVVYPYLKNNSHELEWSLKSLKYFPHNNVYIIGDKPDYTIDAIIVKPEISRWAKVSGYNNVINKLLHVTDMDISEDFLFMMDDVFLLDEYNGATYDRGELLDHADSMYRGSYTLGLRNTHAWLQNNGYPTKDFETHTPMIFNRQKLKYLIIRIIPIIQNSHTLYIRSLYGNVYGVESKYMPIDTKNPDEYKRRKILSTNEITFIGDIGSYIKNIIKKGEV